MKHGTLVFLTSLLPLISGPVRGEPSPVVSPATVGDRVRSQNPHLAAARLTIAEAVGRLRQAGRLDNPEFETELEHNTSFAERGLKLGLSQRFPVTARLRMEKELGAAGVRAAEAEVREVAHQLVGDARSALVRVLALRRRKDLLDEQNELARELADSITEFADRGEASVLDAGQARLEASRFKTRARQLAADEQRALGSLKPLLGMRPDETLVVSGSLPEIGVPGPGEIIDRPALDAAGIAVTAAEKRLGLENTKRLGDVKAGVFLAGRRTVDAPEGAEKEGVVGVSFSVPLPLWDRNEGNIDTAEARLERRRLELDALDRDIRLEAEAARAEMREWGELVREIDRTLLPQAAEQTELTEQAWHNGQADLLDVLRSREQRLELAAARLDAIRDLHLARIRFETALGTN